MRTLRIPLLVVAIALVVAVVGYWPGPASGGGKAPAKVDVALTIDSECSLGSDVVNVNPGDRVQFCNENECMVTIVFENHKLFGRTSVRLDPGKCATLRVRRGAANTTYEMDLDCESCGGGGHTSPEIKVGGGP